MRVYFDNAATTPLDKEVIQAMLPFMEEHFGNPSSVHAFGRKTKTAIEEARKTVARCLTVSPSEIFFTSCGTEANNMAIACSVRDLGIKHIITSKIEHHAVLHTVEALEQQGKIKLDFANLKKDGHVDLEHLEELLKMENGRWKMEDGKLLTTHHSPLTLISLMHGNNEIGNLLPLKKVSELCEKYHALFHSDAVQTIGKYTLDLQHIPIHFVSCSAHKFHGPKGIGFLYINNKVKIKPLLYGGAQERNMRGGTENIYGIVGLAKALEMAHANMKQHQENIQELKSYMLAQLQNNISDVAFNGDEKNGLYTVLNVSFPPSANSKMLLARLDIAGIACSGGSACSSGSQEESHVLKNIGSDSTRASVRFSFSKYNTKQEIDYCIEKLKGFFTK